MARRVGSSDHSQLFFKPADFRRGRVASETTQVAQHILKGMSERERGALLGQNLLETASRNPSKDFRQTVINQVFALHIPPGAMQEFVEGLNEGVCVQFVTQELEEIENLKPEEAISRILDLRAMLFANQSKISRNTFNQLTEKVLHFLHSVERKNLKDSLFGSDGAFSEQSIAAIADPEIRKFALEIRKEALQTLSECEEFGCELETVNDLLGSAKLLSDLLFVSTLYPKETKKALSSFRKLWKQLLTPKGKRLDILHAGYQLKTERELATVNMLKKELEDLSRKDPSQAGINRLVEIETFLKKGHKDLPSSLTKMLEKVQAELCVQRLGMLPGVKERVGIVNTLFRSLDHFNLQGASLIPDADLRERAQALATSLEREIEVAYSNPQRLSQKALENILRRAETLKKLIDSMIPLIEACPDLKMTVLKEFDALNKAQWQPSLFIQGGENLKARYDLMTQMKEIEALMTTPSLKTSWNAVWEALKKAPSSYSLKDLQQDVVLLIQKATTK